MAKVPGTGMSYVMLDERLIETKLFFRQSRLHSLPDKLSLN